MAAPRPATVSFLKQHYGKKLKTAKNDLSLDIGNGQSISGATTITKHMLRTSDQFKGLSLEDRLCAEQWLELCPVVTSLEAAGDREKLRLVMQDLNMCLEDRVYFAYSQLTVADVVLFHSLHSVFEKMSVQEKEKLFHLARWFSHIQHNSKAVESLAPITFLRTMLYDGVAVH